MTTHSLRTRPPRPSDTLQLPAPRLARFSQIVGDARRRSAERRAHHAIMADPRTAAEHRAAASRAGSACPYCG
jgi:hypothetical protein